MTYKNTISELKALISNDFENRLIEAAFKNLEYSANVLRFNNFAYSIRELSRHILYSLAPNEEVLQCSWYRNLIADSTHGITRGQRIKYAIQGGLNDQILTNQVIDIHYIKKAQKSLTDSIEILSKYTHVNPDTFEISQTEIDDLVSKVISSLKLFINTINETRKYIINNIEDKLTNELIEHTLWEVKDDIDILATHHNIEEIEVSKYYINKIGAKELDILAEGTVKVRLQWGSDGDLRRGDGAEMNTSFPFESSLNAKFNKKIQYSKIELDNFDVNTDSWYE
tara:strand:- start:44 stop:892 length:849 start_codon:yes stop_codon:yes gene_type:complete